MDRPNIIRAIVSRLVFCAIVPFLWVCCAKQDNVTAEQLIQRSLEITGVYSRKPALNSMVTFAECTSPSGSYTTEIHTSIDGYTYFKQIFSYRPEAFEAIVEKDLSGFQLGDTMKPLGRELASIIKSHAFQNIIIEIDKRFHDFERPVKHTTDTLQTYKVIAKDELNNICQLFFNAKTGELHSITIQNPDNPRETIQTIFSGWKHSDNLFLPWTIHIYQGTKLYRFNFTRITINSPSFKKMKI